MTGRDLLGALLFAVVVIGLVAMARWLAVALFEYKPHAVYEIDTEDGRLLYVGESSDPERRLHQHESRQRKLAPGSPGNWWPDASAEVRRTFQPSRVTWYRSVKIAKEVQNRMIAERNPIANIIRYKGARDAVD